MVNFDSVKIIIILAKIEYSFKKNKIVT